MRNKKCKNCGEQLEKDMKGDACCRTCDYALARKRNGTPYRRNLPLDVKCSIDSKWDSYYAAKVGM